MKKRIEKIKEILSDGQGAIITDDRNRFYFLGFNSSAGVLVITKEKAYFYIDSRYIEKARKTIKNATVILMEKLYEQLKELFKKEGIKEVLLEPDVTTITETIRWKNALKEVDIITENKLSEVISKLRQIKSEEEIKEPAIYDGLSENQKKLMQFAQTVPEDKAALILKVMQSIVESD